MNTFDRLAPHYDFLEAVLAGPKLARCRDAFWDQIPPPENVLLAGEGHGKSLVEIVRRYPAAKVTCLDASAQMIAVARRRLQNHALSEESVTFVHADILSWQPPGAFDFITTHFFLDCFTRPQLERVIPWLARSLLPEGHWQVADFQIPARGAARMRARAIHWLMYRFFRAAVQLPARSAVPTPPLLAAHGLIRRQHQEFEWGLLYADLWQRCE